MTTGFGAVSSSGNFELKTANAGADFADAGTCGLPKDGDGARARIVAMWVMQAAPADNPPTCLPPWLRVFPLEGEAAPGAAVAPALSFDCDAPGPRPA